MQRKRPSSRTSRPKTIFDRFDEEKKTGSRKRTGEKSSGRDEKRSSEDRPKRDDDRKSRSYGDKPSYSGRSAEKNDSDKKSYDRKPKREGDSESRSYGDKPSYSKRSSEKSYGEKKSYSRKPKGDSDGESRSYDDKPSYPKRSSEKSYGEKKSYSRKPKSDGDSSSRSYSDKPSYFKRSSDRDTDRPKKYGERNSFDRKPKRDDDRESRSYDDKTSYVKRSSDGDERPRKYGERNSTDRGRKSSGTRSYGDKPSYTKRSPDRDDRPKKYGERNSFDRKPKRDDDRESRSLDEKPAFAKRNRDDDSREFRSYTDKPAFKKRSGSDESEHSSERKKYKTSHEREKTETYDDKPFVSKKRESEFDEKPRKYSDKNAKKSDHKERHTHADAGKIRLNKYIANAGICSRREADKLIESGAVTVNGVIITELGHKVTTADIVSYGGTPIKREKSVYVLLNKPKDYITTLDDPEGRKTVLELVKNAGRERIYPVGRLDRNTTGLLLLTNDGEMTAKLTHPKYGVRKVYHVHLDKNLRKEDLNAIADGIELEDGMIKVDGIEYAGDGLDKKEIGIEIHSGKNRIVRRIFESLGYEVLRLDRVIFAGLTKRDLPRGRWRFLTEKEINFLRMA